MSKCSPQVNQNTVVPPLGISKSFPISGVQIDARRYGHAQSIHPAPDPERSALIGSTRPRAKKDTSRIARPWEPAQPAGCCKQTAAWRWIGAFNAAAHRTGHLRCLITKLAAEIHTGIGSDLAQFGPPVATGRLRQQHTRAPSDRRAQINSVRPQRDFAVKPRQRGRAQSAAVLDPARRTCRRRSAEYTDCRAGLAAGVASRKSGSGPACPRWNARFTFACRSDRNTAAPVQRFAPRSAHHIAQAKRRPASASSRALYQSFFPGLAGTRPAPAP